MLKRLYIDNFRCLINCEIKFGPINVLLGENGTGKSAVFAVIRRIQELLAGAPVEAVFPGTDLTRWQTLTTQRFELEVELEGRVYLYSLEVDHTKDRRKCRIEREQLILDGSVLFDFEKGMARLYRDDFSQGPEYPFDWSRSGLGFLQPRPDNTLLVHFRDAVRRFLMAGICPSGISATTISESSQLSPSASNFASWYRFLLQEHQGNILKLTGELRSILDGFDAFSLKEYGESARVLNALFRTGAGSKPLAFTFDELSDGQRVLIILYTLLHGLADLGYALFLDEPENYVSLREIQPWMSALQDACGTTISQAAIISHHPEVIDYLGDSAAIWFERPENGPVRVSDQPPGRVDGLRLSETIARGWQT